MKPTSKYNLQRGREDCLQLDLIWTNWLHFHVQTQSSVTVVSYTIFRLCLSSDTLLNCATIALSLSLRVYPILSSACRDIVPMPYIFPSYSYFVIQRDNKSTHVPVIEHSAYSPRSFLWSVSVLTAEDGLALGVIGDGIHCGHWRCR